MVDHKCPPQPIHGYEDVQKYIPSPSCLTVSKYTVYTPMVQQEAQLYMLLCWRPVKSASPSKSPYLVLVYTQCCCTSLRCFATAPAKRLACAVYTAVRVIDASMTHCRELAHTHLKALCVWADDGDYVKHVLQANTVNSRHDQRYDIAVDI